MKNFYYVIKHIQSNSNIKDKHSTYTQSFYYMRDAKKVVKSEMALCEKKLYAKIGDGYTTDKSSFSIKSNDGQYVHQWKIVKCWY